MDRRTFLQGILAASTTTYFLPPPGGWRRSESAILVTARDQDGQVAFSKLITPEQWAKEATITLNRIYAEVLRG